MSTRHHGWHPVRGTLCGERLGSEPVRLTVEAITCETCLPLIPKPGKILDGVTNDAGVLRRDFTTGSTR